MNGESLCEWNPKWRQLKKNSSRQLGPGRGSQKESVGFVVPLNQEVLVPMCLLPEARVSEKKAGSGR